jgi:hypothetical protein
MILNDDDDDVVNSFVVIVDDDDHELLSNIFLFPESRHDVDDPDAPFQKSQAAGFSGGWWIRGCCSRDGDKELLHPELCSTGMVPSAIVRLGGHLVSVHTWLLSPGTRRRRHSVYSKTNTSVLYMPWLEPS